MSEIADSFRFTFAANSDLRSCRHRIARLVPGDFRAPRVDLATDPTDRLLIGVLTTGLVGALGPDSRDHSIGVTQLAECRIVAGSALDVGDFLTCDGSGAAIRASSGQYAIAVAMGACQSPDEIIRAWIMSPARRIDF